MVEVLAIDTTTDSTKWTQWVLNLKEREREYMKLGIQSADGDREKIGKEGMGGGFAQNTLYICEY